MQIKQLGALIALPVAALAMTACSSTTTTVTATSPAASSTAPASQPASSAPVSSAPASSAPTQTQTVTATATATSAPATTATTQAPATSGGPQPTCSKDDPRAAAQKGIATLKPYDGRAWVVPSDVANTYGACDPLSWIPVTIEGGTGSSPWHILLFHNGEYVGTATAEPQGYKPEIVADGKTPQMGITVTYRYNKPGESNAQASGKAVATFTWNDAQQKVIMTGDVPPKR